MLKSDIASLTIEVIYSPRLRHGIWQIVTIKMAHETAAHSSISSSSRFSMHSGYFLVKIIVCEILFKFFSSDQKCHAILKDI